MDLSQVHVPGCQGPPGCQGVVVGQELSQVQVLPGCQELNQVHVELCQVQVHVELSLVQMPPWCQVGGQGLGQVQVQELNQVQELSQV